MNTRLFLAGNVIIDLVMRVPQLPPRGGDVLASDTTQRVGGGLNVLTAARRMGLPAVYAGIHGTGPFGDRVRAALQAERIDVALPPRTDADTGFCVALVDDGGERTFATAPGAEGALTPDDTARMAAALRPGDIVQLSGYGLAYPGTAAALADFAAALPDDVVLCLDPGPLVADIDAERLRRVLARCDWLSCNRREARLLSDLDDAAAADALTGRIKPGGGVLVRGDADGCWLATGTSPAVHVPGRPVRVVDSNGAGDAHTGAFLALLGQGITPLEAARAANAAAALAVTRPGPATSPTSAELATALGPTDPLHRTLTAD
ncbi:PfkB family carbohydrate kinase [Streptomyces sp. NPDC047117]|uniref:PfkB family carbohydrate kinase n=1 Tax=Streptomyces sp. NPDC047117 TaxID=3155379 RepID=UPI003405CDF4